jgi:hypothetical protein
LNAWDPIGVFDPDDEDDHSGPEDEYACIREPLMSHLLRGDSRDEIAEFLSDELSEHFGYEPWLVTTKILDQVLLLVGVSQVAKASAHPRANSGRSARADAHIMRHERTLVSRRLKGSRVRRAVPLAWGWRCRRGRKRRQRRW